jgi:hypothetical protein
MLTLSINMCLGMFKPSVKQCPACRANAIAQPAESASGWELVAADTVDKLLCCAVLTDHVPAANVAAAVVCSMLLRPASWVSVSWV